MCMNLWNVIPSVCRSRGMYKYSNKIKGVITAALSKSPNDMLVLNLFLEQTPWFNNLEKHLIFGIG